MTWLEQEEARGQQLESAVAALRQEMRSGFARVDARFDLFIAQVNTAIEKQNTTIEKQNMAIERHGARLEQSFKEQTRFFFLAWAVQLAAIVGLYAR